MIKTKKFVSLRLKMLIVLICAFCMCCLFYFTLHSLSDYVISKYYMNSSAVSARTAQYVESFKNYVSENSVSSMDTDKIADWAIGKHNVYLMVYKNDQLIFDSGWLEDESTDDTNQEDPSVNPENGGTDYLNISAGVDTITPENKSDTANNFKNTFFPVQFTDGKVAISIIDFSENTWYTLCNESALILSLIILAVIILVYNHRVTYKIIQISDEVKKVEGGDLNLNITLQGNDEIALLSANVDKMRNSIIDRLLKEQSAWQANCDLITAMSHDIRTPLTALIGYLDIIQDKRYQSNEQLERYLKISKEKATQLKELSDKLFQYFLVFGQPEINLDLKVFDTIVLLQQIINEHTIYLINSGFQVETVELQESCRIEVDVAHIKRVFDNLFLNIEKYADSSKKITIIEMQVNGQLKICISNGIKETGNTVESTNIGLKTCEKIINQLHGTFSYQKENNKFIVEIELPLVK